MPATEALITNAGAVDYGFLVMYAMDMYRAGLENEPKSLTPTVPQRVLDLGWKLVGHVQGIDSLFPKALQLDPGHRTCYGYVLAKADEVVIAIRGTDGFLEWIEDGLFLPTQYKPITALPLGGPPVVVEQGFWQIYGTLELQLVGAEKPVKLTPAAIAELLGTRLLTVVGHSLGAAVATYLTADLAAHEPALRLRACLFASPQPGNQAFADLFGRLVAHYRLFNYSLDVVPRIPFGPDYVALARATVITPDQSETRIHFGLGCNHHVICYCAMLDYERTKGEREVIPDEEKASAACILGPEVGHPSIAKLFHDLIG